MDCVWFHNSSRNQRDQRRIATRAQLMSSVKLIVRRRPSGGRQTPPESLITLTRGTWLRSYVWLLSIIAGIELRLSGDLVHGTTTEQRIVIDILSIDPNKTTTTTRRDGNAWEKTRGFRSLAAPICGQTDACCGSVRGNHFSRLTRRRRLSERQQQQRQWNMFYWWVDVLRLISPWSLVGRSFVRCSGGYGWPKELVCDRRQCMNSSV